MAKKVVSTEKNSIFDIINSLDCGCEVIEESKTARIKDYISTGSLILNAAVSGSFFKGIPCGRITTLAGDPQTGKSFLALSCCREAQKKGYTPIYLDSEGAQDVESVERLGIDTKKFIIKQVNLINEVSSFILNLTDKLLDQPEEERPKVMIVLDSLGGLTSQKEINDIKELTGKKDMTKQQDVKAMFRLVSTPLAKLGIPFIVVTHTYDTLDMYSQKVVSGGKGLNYGASVTLMLSAAKLDGLDKKNDKAAENAKGTLIKTGVVITATPQKSRYTIPQKVKFYIPFYKSPNPFTGIDQYWTWENGGIARGTCYTKAEYDKMKPAEQEKCVEFDYEGTPMYAALKDTARTCVVRHLGKHVPCGEVFSKEVLTDKWLHDFDERVIQPAFRLPAKDEFDSEEESDLLNCVRE